MNSSVNGVAEFTCTAVAISIVWKANEVQLDWSVYCWSTHINFHFTGNLLAKANFMQNRTICFVFSFCDKMQDA